MDLDPTRLIFRGQTIRGTIVSTLQEVDETLDFAKRGKSAAATVSTLGQLGASDTNI